MKEIQWLETQLTGIEVRRMEPMSRHTTFRIGGPADLMVLPNNAQQAAQALRAAREAQVPITVIGNGSDLLVRDGGIRGMVLKLGENMAEQKAEGNLLTFGAGLTLARAASFAASKGFTGMEFAHGIPGSVGGAVFMNAGAYDGEIKQIVRRTWYLDETSELRVIEGEAHQFGYRNSVFQHHPWIIMATQVELQPGDPTAIAAKMKDLMARRREKQPLEWPSAGSTFKRPTGYFAGKLIQDAGLRGYRVGGAMVSEKHCGFVVSDGTATCDDVLGVIRHVQQTVQKKFGVSLECEVRIIGE